MDLTMKDIAKKANVSLTTVSRVFNNKPDVKPETRQMIMEIIREFNYQPNAFARGISLKKSNCIGLIIPRDMEYILSDAYYSDVIRGISTVFSRMGYFLLFLYTDDNEYLINVYSQKRVDGFIFIRVGIYDRDLVKTLNEIEAPFVSTTKILDEKDLAFVDVDHYKGAVLALEHLVLLGHKKIAMIAEKNTLTGSRERVQAYHDVLEKHGIAAGKNMVHMADPSMEGGYKTMKKMLERGLTPTAIFIAGDIMAIGALKAIWEAGKRVPEDISLIGFDGIPETEYTNPPLTTIRQSAFTKGKRAASMLIRRIENKTKIRSVTIDVELVERKSTMACSPMPEEEVRR